MPPEAELSCCAVLCTCPDEDAAARLATGLVDAGLAACVNIVPQIRSIYRWQNAVQDERETLMIIKTTPTRYAMLERWLMEHHPYEVPEVIALPVTAGAAPYLDWVAGQVS